MTAGRARFAGIAVITALAVASCASVSRSGSTGRTLLPSDESTTTAAGSTTTTTEPAPQADCERRHLETASLRPLEPPPPPRQMPAGSYMATILRRGHLNAGVDQNTLGFGYRDPATGQIQGFDVDLLRIIARAIFGSPDAIRFIAVISDQRVPAVKSGAVDIVASLMSMTCDRWQKVDFSSEYYAGSQNVLVRTDSPIHTIADLNGKKVCATRTSTSLDHIRDFAPHAVLYPVDTRTECLAALENGQADAISTDDTILWGFQFQDPDTRLIPLRARDELHAEPYGMAISRKHPEFVRFVNSVLEQVRTDGRWQRLYGNLRQSLSQRFDPPRVIIPADATPPPAIYRSEP